MNKAFFIDRDGVINVEIGYLHEADKVELLPGVAEAVRAIHAAGFLAVVTSNQAGVAKGYYPESDIAAVHSRIQRILLDTGGIEALIDAWYYCPHHPDFTGSCSCRKPRPGMLLQAAEAFNIDTRASFMIGDRMSDLEAGRNAGCAASCMVKSGAFDEQLPAAERAGFPVAENLSAAVDLLLAR